VAHPLMVTSPERAATISFVPSPDYMLQGFVTKSSFSVMLDPFQCR
jgi:hypothetical protein